MAVQELVACGFAQPRVTDQHWDDMARGRHYWQASLGEMALQARRALLATIAFGLALLGAADRGERPGGECRR